MSDFTLADMTVSFDSRIVTRAGGEVFLTPTGWIILLELIGNYPGVTQRDALEDAIWDCNKPNSDILKVHIYELRQKIDKPYDKTLIHTVSNYGFMLQELNF